MSQSSIISDSRPSRAQIFAASLTLLVAVAVGLVAVPYGGVLLPANPGFLPAFGGVTCFADLATAALLIGQARATDSRPAALLAAGYLFSFLIVIPHLLAFPGVFAAQSIIGGSPTATWLWCAWHGGFALCIANYALSVGRQETALKRLWPIFAVVLACVAALVLLTTAGLSYLPVILVGGSYRRMSEIGVGPAVLACNVAALALVIARLRGRNTVALWLGVAMFAATLDVALGLIGAGRFTAGWYLGRGLSLLTNVTVFVALLSQSIRLFSQISLLNRQFEHLSLTDQLTQLPNRRAFEASFEVEWKRARREELPISLLMVDIDHFKAFNDGLGHPAGDRCLRLVAETMNAALRRPLDMAARLGGEEFVLLLPNTEAAGALVMGERVRAAIEALQIGHPAGPARVVTVSIGVATTYPHACSAAPTTIVEQADGALYRAKQSGRNVVAPAEQGVVVDIAAGKPPVLQAATPVRDFGLADQPHTAQAHTAQAHTAQTHTA